MNGISGQDFILGCSAIGAGLAMIAGVREKENNEDDATRLVRALR